MFRSLERQSLYQHRDRPLGEAAERRKDLGAERAMVQKSGYYARSAPANRDDLRLIQSMTDLAVESALNKVSCVTGHDEGQGGKLRTIEFPRIKGGKHFDTSAKWFGEVMESIGQKWKPAA